MFSEYHGFPSLFLVQAMKIKPIETNESSTPLSVVAHTEKSFSVCSQF